MWDFDSIYGKCLVYFGRAQDHTHSDDDEFLIWNLLGLEFLLRAPLAKVHPSLLAAPEGTSVLSALGYSTESEPKSIPTHTVIARLSTIVPAFTKARQGDATVLVNLRNVELHTGEAIARNTSNQFWLPKLVRVADVVADHLDIQIADLFGDEVVALGRSLVDAQDQQLAHEVGVLIEAAAGFHGRLTLDEQTERRSLAQANLLPWDTKVDCPACHSEVKIELETLRRTSERIEDGEFVHDVVKVATRLACPVCGLVLDSTAEVGAAGMSQQYTSQVSESLEERLMDSYEPEYGND
ncbi:hypothetical protein BH10ACT7_BH10ACT7_05540 [soil metagenome]